MRALIIGGGIGGLSTALALRQAGIDAVVFEQTPELREIGAGLLLWAGAMRLLRRLGVANTVGTAGAPVRRTQLRSSDGKVLSDLDIGWLAARHGEDSICIHRASLQQALADALPPKELRLGRVFTHLEQGEDGVTAHFEDGGTERGDLLIAADGLHSTARRQLIGDGLRYAGYTCWRGIADIDVSAGVLTESWGRGARFGFGPLGAGRTLWWATENAPEGGRDAALGRKADVLRVTAGWHAPARDLIAATDEEAILRNDIYDRKRACRWGIGRVTLLGDAAHPATPNLGMGACQAIEDAVILAGCLREREDSSSALRLYEESRRPRTALITDLSWRFGWVSQWSNPVACALRDTLVRLSPAWLERKQMEWLVSGRQG